MAPTPAPKPEPFLAPPPAILEQRDEPGTAQPAPKIDPPSPSYAVTGIVPEPEVAPTPETLSDDLPSLDKPAPVEPPPLPASSVKKSAPRLIPPKKKPSIEQQAKPEPKQAKKDKVSAKQEMMQFEPVTRGRFEKSEPTIVEGQDLDVPTFLRKNIKVK